MGDRRRMVYGDGGFRLATWSAERTDIVVESGADTQKVSHTRPSKPGLSGFTTVH